MHELFTCSLSAWLHSQWVCACVGHISRREREKKGQQEESKNKPVEDLQEEFAYLGIFLVLNFHYLIKNSENHYIQMLQMYEIQESIATL